MKIALITDQHLDGRKGSLAFWNYWQQFYDNIFFPTLEKEGIDTVIDLGDTFDNRKSVDFNTYHRVRENYFEKLAKYNVHMLLGNHCTYYKNTNRINSPELLLEKYDNITIYSEPKHLKLGNKKFLMLPWINKENLEQVTNLLETSEADICCGHLELSGFEITPGMKMDHGMDAGLFHRFKRVWSGHYHHKSKKGNVQYLGNPYQMYWNDYADERGFNIFDTETLKLQYIKNPYEMFHKIFYDDTKNEYYDLDVEKYKDTVVKVVVENKIDYTAFDYLINSLQDVTLDLKIIEDFSTEVDDDTDIELEHEDTLTILEKYVDELNTNLDSHKLKEIMKSLYVEALEVV